MECFAAAQTQTGNHGAQLLERECTQRIRQSDKRTDLMIDRTEFARAAQNNFTPVRGHRLSADQNRQRSIVQKLLQTPERRQRRWLACRQESVRTETIECCSMMVQSHGPTPFACDGTRGMPVQRAVICSAFTPGNKMRAALSESFAECRDAAENIHADGPGALFPRSGHIRNRMQITTGTAARNARALCFTISQGILADDWQWKCACHITPRRKHRSWH